MFIKYSFVIIMSFALLLSGCGNEIKTIEKDGGTKLTLSLSYEGFLDVMSADSPDSIYKLCMQKALSSPYKNFDEFILTFTKSLEEYNPEGTLAPYFATFENKDKINFQSTNEQVIAVLKSEFQKKMNESLQIVSKRIEFFMGQPVSPKIVNETFIEVEIPGITDQKRITNYLLSNGNLAFWETYSNEEIFQYLDAANKKILEMGLVQEKVDVIADSTKKEMSFDEEYAAEMNAKNAKEMEEYNKTNPLFSILMPAVSGDQKLMTGPCIGRSFVKDTATINQLLKNRIISNIFPRDFHFCWTLKPLEQNTDIFELIAIKISQRDGKAPLSGNVITNASIEDDQYGGGSVVSIEMNNEGARIWSRLTAENVGKSIAIVLDNYVYSYPMVQSEIKEGRSSITGNFTNEEASDLANILKAGQYPFKLNIESVEVIKPKNK